MTDQSNTPKNDKVLHTDLAVLVGKRNTAAVTASDSIFDKDGAIDRPAMLRLGCLVSDQTAFEIRENVTDKVLLKVTRTSDKKGNPSKWAYTLDDKPVSFDGQGLSKKGKRAGEASTGFDFYKALNVAVKALYPSEFHAESKASVKETPEEKKVALIAKVTALKAAIAAQTDEIIKKVLAADLARTERALNPKSNKSSTVTVTATPLKPADDKPVGGKNAADIARDTVKAARQGASA